MTHDCTTHTRVFATELHVSLCVQKRALEWPSGADGGLLRPPVVVCSVVTRVSFAHGGVMTPLFHL